VKISIEKPSVTVTVTFFLFLLIALIAGPFIAIWALNNFGADIPYNF
jgi:hypothetical protein